MIQRERRAIAVIAICCTSMVFLDQTAVAVALTPIQRDLGLGQVEAHWVINIYLLGLAALTPVASRLGDAWGRLRVLRAGILLFLGGSIGAAMAGGAPTVLAARALQGVGGAVLSPMSVAIVSDAFPEGERAGALGRVLAISAVFLALGPLFGGLIVELCSWRWVFWLNIPGAAFAVALSLRRDSAPAPTREPVDVAGALTLTGGLAALSVAVMQAKGWGWGSMRTMALLATGAVLLAGFARREWTSRHPLISLALLENRRLLGAAIAAGGMRFAVLGSLIFAVVYLEVILGLTPLASGVAILPASAPLLVLPAIAGRASDRVGPRWPISIGTGACAIALLWLAAVLWEMSYWVAFPGILLYGIGSAVVLTPTTALAVSAVSVKDRGLASGLVSASRQIGGLLGMTVMSAVTTNVELHAVTAFVDLHGGGLRELAQIDGLLSRGAADLAAAMRVLSPDVVGACRHALLSGMAAAFALASAVCALTLVLVNVALARDD